MRETYNKNKKSILISISILVILAIMLGYAVYKSNENKKQLAINSELSSIKEISNNFESEDREEKLDSLKLILEDYNEYKNSANKYNAVVTSYENKVAEMKKWFISDYDKTIIENTLDEITDKESINKVKDNLISLENIIKHEESITLNSEEILQYEEKIVTIIKAYDERLLTIKSEEEVKQAKIKDEEEVKEQIRLETEKVIIQKELENNNNQNNGNSNNSVAENPKVSNTEKPSMNNKVDISRLEHHWGINLDTGEKIPGTDVWIDKSNGNTYDQNGNFLYNGFDW